MSWLVKKLDPRPEMVCMHCGRTGKPSVSDGTSWLAARARGENYMMHCGVGECEGILTIADPVLKEQWTARADAEVLTRAASADAADCSARVALIVGSAGCVGGGIAAAFAAGACAQDAAWDRIVLCDPRQSASVASATVETRAAKFEEIDDTELSLIASSGRSVVIFVADDGDRAHYVVDGGSGSCALAERSVSRFDAWMRRVAAMPSGSRFAHVIVIGGSWTKRVVDADENWVVRDATPNKARADANPYEIAKLDCEACCRELSEQLATLPTVSFVDQISVVPNFSPNFSIATMCGQALDAAKGHAIRFSPGPFGRAVAVRSDSGLAVRLLAALALRRGALAASGSSAGGKEGSAGASAAAGSVPRFARRLIPGAFVPFSEWASIAKGAVLRAGGVPGCADGDVEGGVKFSPYPDGGTPQFLRATTVSDFFADEVGWSPDPDAARAALAETADAAVARLLRGSMKG